MCLPYIWRIPRPVRITIECSPSYTGISTTNKRTTRTYSVPRSNVRFGRVIGFKLPLLKNKFGILLKCRTDSPVRTRNVRDHVGIVLDTFRLNATRRRIDHGIRRADECDHVRVPDL